MDNEILEIIVAELERRKAIVASKDAKLNEAKELRDLAEKHLEKARELEEATAAINSENLKAEIVKLENFLHKDENNDEENTNETVEG